MEPWGSPALTFLHVENYPLRITRCFLSFKKSCKRFSKFPDLLFWVSLKMIPSCHILSNAFAISRNILLTSRPSTKELYIYISWVIDNSWLIQELLDLKPDWLEEISLFSIKNSKISLNINLSRIFLHIGSSDTGRSPFLWIGTMLPSFHWDGKTPVSRHWLKIISKSL